MLPKSKFFRSGVLVLLIWDEETCQLQLNWEYGLLGSTKTK